MSGITLIKDKNDSNSNNTASTSTSTTIATTIKTITAASYRSAYLVEHCSCSTQRASTTTITATTATATPPTPKHHRHHTTTTTTTTTTTIRVLCTVSSTAEPPRSVNRSPAPSSTTPPPAVGCRGPNTPAPCIHKEKGKAIEGHQHQLHQVQNEGPTRHHIGRKIEKKTSNTSESGLGFLSEKTYTKTYQVQSFVHIILEYACPLR